MQTCATRDQSPFLSEDNFKRSNSDVLYYGALPGTTPFFCLYLLFSVYSIVTIFILCDGLTRLMLRWYLLMLRWYLLLLRWYLLLLRWYLLLLRYMGKSAPLLSCSWIVLG